MTRRNVTHYNRLPSNTEIDAIPLSLGVEFELSDKEMMQLRRHLYAVNRDGIRRYRTVRVDQLLMVWRIQ